MPGATIPHNGVVAILRPTRRIFFNVFPNTAQVAFVANDVLIIIALPHRCTAQALTCVNGAGGKGFERAHDFGQRVHLCRGGFQTRPYGGIICQNNDAVNMVRHHHEAIQRNMMKMGRQFIP